jgi:cell division protein FtsI (penicillin-binding protein 3)
MGRTLHDDKSDHYGVITVQQALEHSSDVGAAKMAMKLGNQKFYEYMKAFGFGDRSGIELPSETRGLLRAPKKWDATSFMSLAIGQEVGVTPVQLAAMVSTIANGGVYLPPRILLQSTDAMKGDPRLKPAAFHPGNGVPNPLPDGGHRVIKEMTSATMREIMRGIVIEGTGKEAALNGYSSGGKTGTAEKIDVATHTYSHTKLVASFAGMAPVSNPAITVAVVIDTPTVGVLYGGTVSAPVFAQVAQEVLEYLGVPHDQPLKTKKEMQLAKADVKDVFDSPADESGADLNAMFADVNSLPAEDPLRASTATGPVTTTAASASSIAKQPGVMERLSDKVMAEFRAHGGTTSTIDVGEARVTEPKIAPAVAARSGGGVVVDASRRVAVPSFGGAALRTVVEQAGEVGLRVQPVGSGLARDQVPAAGTMVPSGTEVVVRFSR